MPSTSSKASSMPTRPLQRCSYEGCNSPNKSAKFLRIPVGCSTGGKDWTELVGSILCTPCHSYFRCYGTLKRTQSHRLKGALAASARRCSYKECIRPEKSCHFYRVEQGNTAGGQDWSKLVGRVLCASCYLQFKSRGTLKRSFQNHRVRASSPDHEQRCSYERCKRPSKSSKFYLIDHRNKGGGQDWSDLAGRVLCRACYQTYLSRGTLERCTERSKATSPAPSSKTYRLPFSDTGVKRQATSSSDDDDDNNNNNNNNVNQKIWRQNWTRRDCNAEERATRGTLGVEVNGGGDDCAFGAVGGDAQSAWGEVMLLDAKPCAKSHAAEPRFAAVTQTKATGGAAACGAGNPAGHGRVSEARAWSGKVSSIGGLGRVGARSAGHAFSPKPRNIVAGREEGGEGGVWGRFLSMDDETVVYSLSKKVTTVGRNKGCDVVIDIDVDSQDYGGRHALSRKHLLLTYDSSAGVCSVSDMSTNGTLMTTSGVGACCPINQIPACKHTRVHAEMHCAGCSPAARALF